LKKSKPADQTLLKFSGTGIRHSEVIAIADYNTRNGALNIQAVKGDQQRPTYLNTESRLVIRQLLTEQLALQQTI
jgi:site-specific recombinase XerD